MSTFRRTASNLALKVGQRSQPYNPSNPSDHRRKKHHGMASTDGGKTVDYTRQFVVTAKSELVEYKHTLAGDQVQCVRENQIKVRICAVQSDAAVDHHKRNPEFHGVHAKGCVSTSKPHIAPRLPEAALYKRGAVANLSHRAELCIHNRTAYCIPAPRGRKPTRVCSKPPTSSGQHLRETTRVCFVHDTPSAGNVGDIPTRRVGNCRSSFMERKAKVACSSVGS